MVRRSSQQEYLTLEEALASPPASPPCSLGFKQRPESYGEVLERMGPILEFVGDATPTRDTGEEEALEKLVELLQSALRSARKTQAMRVGLGLG